VYDPNDAQGDMKLAIMGLQGPHVKKEEPVAAAAVVEAPERPPPPSPSPPQPQAEPMTEAELEPGSSQQEGAADTPAPESDFVGGTVGALHSRFKPLWLGEADGWSGGDHDDAAEFCAGIRGKSLCPYSAMCPNGPGGAVMGGRHQAVLAVKEGEGAQYAPVMGGSWVLIHGGGADGPGTEDVCRSYEQLNGDGSVPEVGEGAEMRHIMCCTV